MLALHARVKIITSGIPFYQNFEIEGFRLEQEMVNKDYIEDIRKYPPFYYSELLIKTSYQTVYSTNLYLYSLVNERFPCVYDYLSSIRKIKCKNPYQT